MEKSHLSLQSEPGPRLTAAVQRSHPAVQSPVCDDYASGDDPDDGDCDDNADDGDDAGDGDDDDENVDDIGKHLRGLGGAPSSPPHLALSTEQLSVSENTRTCSQ